MVKKKKRKTSLAKQRCPANAIHLWVDRLENEDGTVRLTCKHCKVQIIAEMMDKRTGNG